MPLHAMQQRIQQQLPELRALHERYGLDLSVLERLEPLIQRFEIRIPLIGAFSSGKSSLLNALLEENLLATDITPETAIPTELSYAPERRLIGHLADGQEIALKEADLQDNQLTALSPSGWVEARLPSPALKPYPQLVLVDLPGWESGIEHHQRAIDAYIDRSLAYAVVVSAEEGALRESMRRVVQELAAAQMPVVLIITKADKRTEEDVQDVASHVQAELTQLLQRELWGVAITSARKRLVRPLHSILQALQKRTGEIFLARVLEPYRQHLLHCQRQLERLLNQDNNSIEQTKQEIELLKQDIQALDDRLKRETERFKTQLGSLLGALRLRLENALRGRLDTLTNRALNGRDISEDILGTARVVLTEFMRAEFEPQIRRHFERMIDDLPSHIDLDLRLDLDRGEASQQGFQWKDLATAASPLLLAIPHPVGKVLAVVVPMLASLFDSRANRQRQELERARQREEARSQVIDAIVQATTQLTDALRPQLTQSAERALHEATRRIQAERSETETILQSRLHALQQDEAAAAAMRQIIQADLKQLQAWLDALSPTP